MPLGTIKRKRALIGQDMSKDACMPYGQPSKKIKSLSEDNTQRSKVVKSVPNEAKTKY